MTIIIVINDIEILIIYSVFILISQNLLGFVSFFYVELILLNNYYSGQIKHKMSMLWI